MKATLEPKTLLVTGSSGFIAFHTISHFLEQGFYVVGVDNHNDSTSVFLKETRCSLLKQHPHFTFILGDVTSREFLMGVFSSYQFCGVVNLAAKAGVRASLLDPESYMKTNEMGLINIIACCLDFGVSNIVQASTSSVYSGEAMPFLEESAANCSTSPYAASKKAAENYAFVYHKLYGLNITVLRFFTVYGPLGRPDMSVFRFIKWIYEGKPLVLNGDGTQTRDFTYVKDAATAVFLAFSKAKGYHIFNVGNNTAYSLLQMIALLEAQIGKKAQIQFKEVDPTDAPHTHANITKIKKELGWEPTIPLEQGLQRTVDWFKKELDWVNNIPL